MSRLRSFVFQHALLAWLMVGAALAMKVLVPAGFMPVAEKNGTITVRICSGTLDGPMTMEMAMPGLPGGKGDHHKSGKAEMPCAFAGLAMPMLSGADPLLLVLAIALIMALASRVLPPAVPRRSAYLRPPLRGPPITA